MIAPPITASGARAIVFAPKRASSLMTGANPMTRIPIPMPTSLKPLYWATRDPKKATSAFPIASPKIFMLPVWAEKLLTIASLSPVARKARPISVFKNADIPAWMTTATTSITINMAHVFGRLSPRPTNDIRPFNKLSSPVPAQASWIFVIMVVWESNGMLDAPMIRKLIE
ncbi:hypothetical protein SRABI80_03135 [Peribacillus frigoritolerans]|nr:hypothetical protein SRABI80_03135 [Peribacillus frigoritolerans]